MTLPWEHLRKIKFKKEEQNYEKDIFSDYDNSGVELFLVRRLGGTRRLTKRPHTHHFADGS
jgi:hypothetical protein